MLDNLSAVEKLYTQPTSPCAYQQRHWTVVLHAVDIYLADVAGNSNNNNNNNAAGMCHAELLLSKCREENL